MKHTILTTLLTLGVVGGLTYGVLSHHHQRWEHRTRFQEHVANICVEATLRTLGHDSDGATKKKP